MSPSINRAYLITLYNSSSFKDSPTDLADFLEVELWQGMEPVGKLSEVEKLHLKPGPDTHRQAWVRQREKHIIYILPH